MANRYLCSFTPTPVRVIPGYLTIAEFHARANSIVWTPEQLRILEAESIKARGEIPMDEQYTWIHRKFGVQQKPSDDIKLIQAIRVSTIPDPEALQFLTGFLGLVRCQRCCPPLEA